MLPRDNRLVADEEFAKVMRQGNTVGSPLFVLKYILADQTDGFRLGIIVSTKISTKAHVRNKIKRQIRAIVAEYLKEVKKDLSVDVVIITKKPILEADYDQIKVQLIKILNNVK